jgi:hypothetical protein
MEAKGKVNIYICDDCNLSHHTINLNTGTTPFGCKCPFCNGYNCYSMAYRTNSIRSRNLEILWCWYRPTRENLCLIEDDETIRHILRGGLIKGEIGSVTPLNDDVDIEWTFDEYVEWCEKTYGQRPSYDNPWFSIDRRKLNG